MDLWKALFENAPALFVAVVAVVLILGAVLTPLFKFLGIVVIGGTKAKVVDEEVKRLATVNTGVGDIKGELAEIKTLLGAFESRIGLVEAGVQNRATREEMHKLELSFTRLEGEVKSQALTTQNIYTMVSRIDDFMYREALRTKITGASAGV